MIGGQFSSFGGEPYSCLVRLQPSGFVGTDDHAKRGALNVYPNPARQYFRIELPNNNQRIERVDILDLHGRTVLSPGLQHGGDFSINIEGLPPGMYLVKAQSTDGMYTEKLIVQ